MANKARQVNEDKVRILLACKETAGDIFILSGVIDGIKKKFPNSKLYFATDPQFHSIAEGNPQVDAVIEYHPSMVGYRNWETWGPEQKPFDIVFHPSIVTQHIPHWIHNGYGEYLGDVYADLCHVDYGEQWIGIDDSINDLLPATSFITVHSQSRQDPKDFDRIDEVVSKIKGIKIVQIGGKDDKRLENVDVDLRGKTTPQQLHYVFKESRMHLGMDSFPMHVALHAKCPTVALFGGTYAKQGTNPRTKSIFYPIETQDRGACVTSCHLVECEMKKQGIHDKCINNIKIDDVVSEIQKILGDSHIKTSDSLTISSYLMIKNGIEFGFPFEQCIEAAAKATDEVVVVDGGSTDGTWEKLRDLQRKLRDTLVIFQHEWDMDNPTLFGDEKTYARELCSGDYVLQLDADEIIHEHEPRSLYTLIENHQDSDILDLPCINFYGDNDHIRIEDNCWKWRISKNDKRIIHGVHKQARQEQEDGTVSMDKKISDGCEYIYSDTLEIAQHKIAFPMKYMVAHEKIKHTKDEQREKAIKAFKEELSKLIESGPVVFHYSWHDLDRKVKNGQFWDETYHGKTNETHNTTADITTRINKGEDLIVHVDIDHPLKVRNNGTIKS